MNWDPRWDHLFSTTEWGAFPNECLVRSFSPLASRLEKPPVVLELGCGTGANFALYQKYQSIIYGIDASSSALSVCKNKSDPSQSHNRLQLLQYDLYEFSPSSLNKRFDFVVDIECLYSLSIPRAKKIIDDCANILEPGGSFISVMFSDRTDMSLLRQFNGVSTRTLPEVQYLFGKFTNVSIERTSRTKNSMTALIDEYIVIASNT